MVLPNEITIYVNDQEFVGMIAKELTALCGGATVTKGGGYWTKSDGELIAEPVALVSAFTDLSFDTLWSNLRTILYTYKKQAKQDAVLISFNGAGILLDGITNGVPHILPEAV